MLYRSQELLHSNCPAYFFSDLADERGLRRFPEGDVPARQKRVGCTFHVSQQDATVVNQYTSSE
jgi:hypothetical protein